MVLGRMQIVLPLLTGSLLTVPGYAWEPIDYQRDVKPLLKTHCVRCHGPLRSEAGLRLDTRSLAVAGGENGPALVAGKPAESLLLSRVRGDDETRMPPEGERLTAADIAILTSWITAGAPAPADEQPADPRSHWAYQPIERPTVPAAKVPAWSGNPIDAFIHTQHQKQSLTPNAVAPPHVLLRRVHLDLTGLPPAGAALHAFSADASAAAYAQAVDRLLASPHYGERWGRHWLDVWRYSDWYGFQGTPRFSQKNIWHWRDWVVESLNADKGYERMVMEMLAGDELLPFEPGNLRATGFLVRNRNTDSREQWIRDTVEHTAKAFLGMTMACVQCHDHPYDPIWHEEYYRFRNIFEPVQVGIDNGGGGPGGVDIAGVARIFDRDRNAATKFYIRGNDRTPDKTRKITPAVPRLFPGWVTPQEVGLPPLARIPLLRTPVAKQATARLEDAVRLATNAVREAGDFHTQSASRLTTASTDSTQPGGDTLLLESFLDDSSTRWKQGPGLWKFADGRLLQSDFTADQQCWLEHQVPGGGLTDFRARLRFRLTGGGEHRSAGIAFDRSPVGGRSEGVFLTADAQRQGLAFYSEFEETQNATDKLFRPLPIPNNVDFILRLDVRDRLVNVYLNDVLLQAYQLANRAPGGFRLWTKGATAEFHHLRIDRLPADAALAPVGSIELFAPTVRPDKSDPAHELFAQTVIQHKQLQLAVSQSELTAHKAAWSADSWRLLKTPDPEDTLAVAEHKIRQDMLAVAANRAQRELALHKARLARFLAEQALRTTTLLAGQSSGTPGDQPQTEAAKEKEIEARKKKLADAKKKVETTGEQIKKAETALQQPGEPKYSGLPGSYGSSSGRRLSLANWIAAPQNPLTARVAVNHIWLRYFQRALVRSVFDFGVSGQPPSHPALLDWLAAELQQPSLVLSHQDGRPRWVLGDPQCGSWSMKHLHRLIVTSRAYRSSSTSNEDNQQIDPDNVLLWRMPARRMDAETVRDSVLVACQRLDRTLGGPDLPCEDGMSVRRRSLYFHHSPEKQMSFLKLFDGADPTECYQRHVSIVPQQALALFNSQLALEQSRSLARRLSEEFDKSDPFIQAAFEQVLTRPATVRELAICRQFLNTRESAYRTVAVSGAKPDTSDLSQASAHPGLHARENLVHSLLNHHEFVTIK